MSIPIGYGPQHTGCTHPGCGTQETSTLDGRVGRRCSDHPAPFDRDWALTLVDLGRAGEAFEYLRQWLSAEASRRFETAIGRLIAAVELSEVAA